MSMSVGAEVQCNEYSQKLEKILGCKLEVSIYPDGNRSITKNNTISGTFFKIITEGQTYLVCPGACSRKKFTMKGSYYSDVNDFKEVKGVGAFECQSGCVDETGKKILNFFFSNHRKDEIIFCNFQKRKLTKCLDGSIGLRPISKGPYSYNSER